MNKLCLLVLFLILTLASFGQLCFSEAELIMQSRHVWRGEKLGTAPTVEPSVTFASGRLSFNVWAAKTLNNSYSEINLVPAFQFKYLQLTLFDYYNPVQGEKNRFLIFQNGKNRHSVELTLDNYSVEEQKLKWMVGTFLLGDKNKETGHPYFSSYVEVKYPFKVVGIETEPFLGITPFQGYYAGKLALVNTGISFSKEISISSYFSIPLNLSFISNPYTRNSFVIFAAGIAF
ncbi:MAG: hypothetical protein WAO52_10200 [Prolixibacteraceae bacterium]